MSSRKTILFSANDPGGANAILPVVQNLLKRGDQMRGITTGPALTAFRTAGVPVIDGAITADDNLVNIVAAIKPSLFLAGTSIGESIDKRIFRMLGATPSVYVIDFWSHYGHRFVEKQADLSHVPTKVCVIDDRMLHELRSEGFPDRALVITGNPHFDHFTEGITRETEDRSRVLFVSQPIREDIDLAGAEHRGYDEFSTLKSIIDVLPPALRLSIRMHPRDVSNKYEAYLSDRVSIAKESTLEQALSHAGLVIGMFSPVLMQSALAGKPTISYQPGLMNGDRLPTNELGITQGVTEASTLSALLDQYVRGLKIFVEKRTNPFPAGATERVVTVVDSLIE